MTVNIKQRSFFSSFFIMFEEFKRIRIEEITSITLRKNSDVIVNHDLSYFRLQVSW